MSLSRVVKQYKMYT